MYRSLRAASAISLVATAALAPLEAAADTAICRPHIETPRYASAVFNRPGGPGGALIGNAFAVYANPGPVCAAAGAPACAVGQQTRGWNLTMVTAAHVVQQMCAGAPGSWQGVGNNWVPGKLTLFATNYPLGEQSVVEVTISADWCEQNIGALGQVVSGGDDTAEANGSKQAQVHGPPSQSDIWVFRQVFDVPTRALVAPFSIEFLRPDENPVKLEVRGFLPNTDADHHKPFSTSDGREVFFGNGEGHYDPETSPKAKYSFNYDAVPGQSGSPVGRVDQATGAFTVMGVLIENGWKTCENGLSTKRKRQAGAGGGPADSGGGQIEAEQDANQDLATKQCVGDPEVRHILKASDNTAYFVPILRYPLMYEPLRNRITNVRIDVAIRIYEELAALKQASGTVPGPYRRAFVEVMDDLSPLEQTLVLMRIKESDTMKLSDVVCARLEPDPAATSN